ncbi:MAG TPA: T9SS type A sorting domain-containing protein [Saprospiraceae bacterium]|nr:T9SS type A sorting domain-containing protein [Saprospiraceae bacterium]HMQ83965.1 T9SS type A sorting domain-containing protein [Saprospiraceae bacterium]
MKRLLLLMSLFISTHLAVNAQDLISISYLQSKTQAQLIAEFNNPLFQNGVDLYKMTYTTPDVNGLLDTASGLFVMPQVSDRDLSFLCYQHGTVGSKQDVPSNLAGGYELAVVYGGMGFLTVAPDYLGLGEARGFHPYLHAATEASAAIDMLYAAKQYADSEAIGQTGLLFVTGYSQGGHAAMALHRELQWNFTADWPVTAAAPMSGPYSLGEVIVDFGLSDTEYFYPSYLPFIVLGLNEAYDLYEDFAEIFQPIYLPHIIDYYEAEIDLGTLNQTLIELLQQEVGYSYPRFLLQDSVLQGIITNPDHPLNAALRDNNVYDWIPEVPTRLYYCTADDQVDYRNSVFADSVMNANGAADVMAIDVNPTANHFDCVEPAVLQAIFFFRQQEILQDVGQEPTSSKHLVKVYPNPATDRVQFEWPKGYAVLSVFDQDGRVVFQKQATGDKQATLNISTWAAGTYYWVLMSEAGTDGGKVVKRD